MPDDPSRTSSTTTSCPAAGSLIWHVDEFAAVDRTELAIRRPEISTDRRGVDIEEADGIQDIGSASSEFFGGPFDPYFLGGFSRFDAETVPNTQTNDRTETGIGMEVVDTVGVTMRVSIGRPRLADGFPLAFLGTAVPEALNQADLDGDGFDKILMAAGTGLFAIRSDGDGFADGGERVLFSSFPAALDEGPRVVYDWGGAPSETPTVLARAGGQAWWFDGPTAGLIGRWPDDPRRAWVSAGPIQVDGVLVAGTRAGALVGLGPTGGTADRLWEISVPGLADSTTALAAGRTQGGDPVYIAAGTAEGSIYLASGDDLTVAPGFLRGWPQKIGEGPVRDMLLLQAPLRYGDLPRTLILSSVADRKVDLRDVTGASVPGWPKAVADTLAGSPAVGDLDGDGVLEVCAVTQSGDLYLWDLNGTTEVGWPRSLGIRIECADRSGGERSSDLGPWRRR